MRIPTDKELERWANEHTWVFAVLGVYLGLVLSLIVFGPLFYGALFS